MYKFILKLIQTNNPETDYELIKYGLILIKNDLKFLIPVFIIGFFLNIEWNILCFYMIFLPLRNSLPGFHCKTQLKCLIFSISFSLIVSYVSNSVIIPLKYNLIILSSFFMLLYTLILPMDKKQKIKAIAVQFLFFSIGIICVYFSICTIYNLIVITLFSLSILNFKYLIFDYSK